MSLMHDALKDLDKAATSTAGMKSFGFMIDESRPDSSGKLKSILVGALPLLLIGAASAWWMNKQDIQPSLPPMAKPFASEPVPVEAAAKTGNDSTVVTAPIAKAASMPYAVEENAKAIPAINHDASVHKPKKQAEKRSKEFAHHHVPPPAIAKILPPSTEVIFPEFLKALDRGDAVASRGQLDKLVASLPPDSLTLLRAQAWYAIKTGDETSARKYYETLLARKTGDEEASINLAAIESKMGHADSAMAILSDAMRNNPDSAALHQGMQKLGGGK